MKFKLKVLCPECSGLMFQRDDNLWLCLEREKHPDNALVFRRPGDEDIVYETDIIQEFASELSREEKEVILKCLKICDNMGGEDDDSLEPDWDNRGGTLPLYHDDPKQESIRKKLEERFKEMVEK